MGHPYAAACGHPIWLINASRNRRSPGLTTRLDTDVVIVGGGVTGAAIAHVFAEVGLRVSLVEGALVGRGSTGASTALLLHETDEELSSLEKRYGRRRARRIWELSRCATRDVANTIPSASHSMRRTIQNEAYVRGFGFLAARLLLDAVRNVPNSDLQLFAFNRRRQQK